PMIQTIKSVGQQAADVSELPGWIDGREPVASSEGSNFGAMAVREGVRYHRQASIWLARLSGNGGFELGRVEHRRRAHLHSERRSGDFHGIQVIFGECSRDV